MREGASSFGTLLCCLDAVECSTLTVDIRRRGLGIEVPIRCSTNMIQSIRSNFVLCEGVDIVCGGADIVMDCRASVWLPTVVATVFAVGCELLSVILKDVTRATTSVSLFEGGAEARLSAHAWKGRLFRHRLIRVCENLDHV